MTRIQSGQIKAMVTLLSDPDPRTSDLVKDSLLERGEEAIPSILHACGIVEGGTRRKLEGILGEIRFNRLDKDLGRWRRESEIDSGLEKGAFLLAQIAYPDLDILPYQKKLDEISRSLKKSIRHAKNDKDIILRINGTLFGDEGFRGDTENYYDPDNSYLNRVMDRRAGIPISLSVIYLLIARRLGLPLSGVGLPGHFVIKYETEGFTEYLDVFNQGRTLSREDCFLYLRQGGYPAEQSFLESVPNHDIILRMIRNLIPIYQESNNPLRVERLTRLVKTLQSNN